MLKAFMRSVRGTVFLVVCAIAFVATSAFAVAGSASVADTDAPQYNGGKPLCCDEEAEEELLQLDLAFTSSKTAGSSPITLSQAGELRGKAAKAAKKLRKEHIPVRVRPRSAAPWTQIGPNPIVQGLRTPGAQRFGAMSGRIGALAIRPSNGKFILGAAQGGIWLYDPVDAGRGRRRPSDQTTQSIGALAIAPSNDAIIYAGTGEGALSGDSYFGDGVLKSTDGGNTWAKVSDDKYFNGVAMSRVVVDPANADHVYAAVLRGRGGARRTSPPDPTRSASGSRRTAASTGS